MKSKIVVLDGYTMNPGDLDWSHLNALGEVTIYDRSPDQTVYTRALDADIIVSNKVKFDKNLLSKLPQLKCICVSATGYNNIDVKSAREQNIEVCNVVGYSSHSVAQHVFAMILKWTNQVGKHCAGVHRGEWSEASDWSYWYQTIPNLAGQTFGIYGLGKIGSQVANIALAFGMKVIALHKHPERDFRPDVEFVDENELFAKSDFLSLHAPLTATNKYFINSNSLKKMKSTSLLINTGRGDLVNELDLKIALETGLIAGAALDVLSEEPPPANHPLIGTKNCIITPHQAWGGLSSRKKLLAEIVLNIKAFKSGQPRNLVN